MGKAWLFQTFASEIEGEFGIIANTLGGSSFLLIATIT